MNTLKEDLDRSLEKESKELPTWLKDYLIKKLIMIGKQANPLQVADKLTDGKLISHLGEPIVLSKLLEDKPAIISFYRGCMEPILQSGTKTL